MDSHRELARQLIGDIGYRKGVTSHIVEPTEAYTLANYAAHTATHVSRRMVDNRWCAIDQQVAFRAYHERVLEDCREIVRLAMTGAETTAIGRYAALLADAAAQAPGARSLTTAAIF